MLGNEYRYKNLLVPVRHPNDVNRITELASVLVDHGKIIFLTVVEEGSFIEMQKDWRRSSKTIERYREKTAASRWTKIVPKIRYSEAVWQGVLEEAEENDSDLILMGWGGKMSLRSLRQNPLERIFANSDRDVLVFKNRTGNVQDIKKILFPVGYKDYDYRKRLSVTAKLIEGTKADCVLVHILQEDETEEEAQEILNGPKTFMHNLGVECETKIIQHKKISKALIEETKKDYDLIILGPTKEYVFTRYLFGWMTDEIVNGIDCSALIFKEGEQKWKALVRGMLTGLKKEIGDLFK